jgi:toxin ParE1/3/4
MLRDIGKVAALISEHPLSGRAREEIRPGLRSFATGPHIVFYRIEQARPQIVRVLDGRQDIEDIFAENG